MISAGLADAGRQVGLAPGKDDPAALRDDGAVLDDTQARQRRRHGRKPGVAPDANRPIGFRFRLVPSSFPFPFDVNMYIHN